MQTPIQQARQRREQQLQLSTHVFGMQLDHANWFNKGLSSAINTLTALLPTEREVIEEAFQAGMDYESCQEGAMCFNDYFTTKFNNDGTQNKS